MEKEKRIVVLGGSFNPPTVAHARLLLKAVDELGAEIGIFAPSSYEYVKNKMAKSSDPSFVLSEEIRREMLSVMAADDRRLRVETVEYGKKASGENKWRTIDTLNAISEKYPQYEIYFLAGGDKLDMLPRWTRITELLENYRVVAVKRGDYDPEKDIAGSEFLSGYRRRFCIMTAPEGAEGVSSSAVRDGISSDSFEAVKEMCHPSVWKLLLEAVGKRDREICGFFGEYRFLSNFYEAPIVYRGLKYRSNEAAFQAQKCLDEEEMRGFTALSPREAKERGRLVVLRSDWEAVKIGIMEEIVRAKFTQNEKLAVRLIDTGDCPLIEGNDWDDLFWGVDIVTRKGDNHLGRILMKVRDELNAGVYTATE